MHGAAAIELVGGRRRDASGRGPSAGLQRLPRFPALFWTLYGLVQEHWRAKKVFEPFFAWQALLHTVGRVHLHFCAARALAA